MRCSRHAFALSCGEAQRLRSGRGGRGECRGCAVSGRLPGFGSLACSRIRAAGHANCFWPRRTLCDHGKSEVLEKQKRCGETRNVVGSPGSRLSVSRSARGWCGRWLVWPGVRCRAVWGAKEGRRSEIARRAESRERGGYGIQYAYAQDLYAIDARVEISIKDTAPSLLPHFSRVRPPGPAPRCPSRFPACCRPGPVG